MSLRIGFVYDLRSDYAKLGYSDEVTAEFDSEETITAITAALTAQGHEVERVGNIRHLVQQLAAGNRWDLVFNIAEGLHGIAREAQVPGLLEAYAIPYVFSPPEVLVVAHHKGLAKECVMRAGLASAEYAVVTKLAEIHQVNLPYPLFAKPLAEGTGKGVSARSLVHTPQELRNICAELLKTHQQPVLIETYLPGREFTVGVLGSGHTSTALGVLEVVLGADAEMGGHTYHNKENCERLVTYHLVNDATALRAQQLAISAWQALGGRDGGRIDIRCDVHGEPHFLEVNPLPGLHPTHSDLPILSTMAGVSHHELIQRIVAAAQARYPQLQSSVPATTQSSAATQTSAATQKEPA